MSKHIRAYRSQHTQARLPIFSSAYHHMRKEQTERIYAEKKQPRKAKKEHKKLTREIVKWFTRDRIPQLPGNDYMPGFSNLEQANNIWINHNEVNK